MHVYYQCVESNQGSALYFCPYLQFVSASLFTQTLPVSQSSAVGVSCPSPKSKKANFECGKKKQNSCILWNNPHFLSRFLVFLFCFFLLCLFAPPRHTHARTHTQIAPRSHVLSSQSINNAPKDTLYHSPVWLRVCVCVRAFQGRRRGLFCACQ